MKSDKSIVDPSKLKKAGKTWSILQSKGAKNTTGVLFFTLIIAGGRYFICNPAINVASPNMSLCTEILPAQLNLLYGFATFLGIKAITWMRRFRTSKQDGNFEARIE